jgi:carboxypeptidase Q
VMEAARLIARLPTPPRRTVRVVLYQDEENRQTGGKAYAAAHAAELPRHVAALECDAGAFAPVGFSVQGDSTALDQVRELARPLAPLGVTDISPGGSGVDVSFIVRQGVVGLGHHVDGAHYFDYHHSPADTFDKVDARDLAKNIAAIAGLAWAVADAPEPLHRAPVAKPPRAGE